MGERWGDGSQSKDALVGSAPMDVGPQAEEEAEADERNGKVGSHADVGEARQNSSTTGEVDEQGHQDGIEQSDVRGHELKEQLLLVRHRPDYDLLG
jgi:hypothetical protein